MAVLSFFLGRRSFSDGGRRGGRRSVGGGDDVVERVVGAAAGVAGGHLLVGEQAGVEQRGEPLGVQPQAGEAEALAAVAVLGPPVQGGGRLAVLGDQL